MNAQEIAERLGNLPLRGASVIAHASLSSFGEVEGGAAALCRALMLAVGDAGTLLMPTFTYTETLGPAPGATRSSTAGGQAKAQPFQSDFPVSREIGVVPEVFRALPGVRRSNHPTHSFAAWGAQAHEILSTQRDNNPLGPLKKLNLLQGHVLLLGTSLLSATAVHLAEERFGTPYLTRRTALRINTAGYQERVVLENVPGCSLAFLRLEDRLDPAKVRSVPLARGAARQIPVRYLLQTAAAVLDADPGAFVCERPDCESCIGKRAALERLQQTPGH
jgi:aminoglycoside 3-N-acetyltransferase